MPKATGKKEFHWTDDEAELLLTVTHQYKIRCIENGTPWESVKSKYTDILEMFRSELPASEEERYQLTKDYPHQADELTKEILTSKLKAIRNKYRQVRFLPCKKISLEHLLGSKLL